jgi:enoyl-CoA hydratase
MNETHGPALVEVIDRSIAIVQFNRPAERNSLSANTLHSLDALLTTLIADVNLRAIIFTGTDDVFLSGADIRELSILDEAGAFDFSEKGQKIMQRIADSAQVTIAAINGYCMGGGLDLALACNVRVASTTARFAHPGARLGIITGWGGTQRLPHLIGKPRALEILLAARQLTSSEALKCGLVSVVADPVLETALGIARARN